MGREDKEFKRKQKAFEEQCRVEKEKRERAEMLQDAKNSNANVERELDKWYRKYEKAAQEGDYKTANLAFKAFNFMFKLKKFSTKYVDLLEFGDVVYSMMSVFEQTGKRLASISTMSSGGITRSIRRNFKKFVKGMNKLDKNMDKMTLDMDKIFDEKPSKFKKGGGLSDEEIFRNNSNSESIRSDQSSRNIESAPVSTPSQTQAPISSGGGGILPPE